MAKKFSNTVFEPANDKKSKRTSIGSSRNSRPKNKHARKSHKRYNRQG